jgi:hypothetical protein
VNGWYTLNPDHTVSGPAEELRFQDIGERIVAKTQLGDVEVSTVFLGLDHAWGYGPPLLFETLIFGGPYDGEMDRYSTWDEATAGHERFVAALRRGVSPSDEVVDERPVEESQVERPAGEEWADWDAAEINAVRSAYVAEYGPELEAERQDGAA